MYLHIHLHKMSKSSKMAHFVFKCNKEDYLLHKMSCTAKALEVYKNTLTFR
jgi:hypothetical protein